jgi:hypothetical protein
MCGKHTACAYVLSTRLGPRWLDLCMRDAYWLRHNTSEGWSIHRNP